MKTVSLTINPGIENSPFNHDLLYLTIGNIKYSFYKCLVKNTGNVQGVQRVLGVQEAQEVQGLKGVQYRE